MEYVAVQLGVDGGELWSRETRKPKYTYLGDFYNPADAIEEAVRMYNPSQCVHGVLVNGGDTGGCMVMSKEEFTTYYE